MSIVHNACKDIEYCILWCDAHKILPSGTVCSVWVSCHRSVLCRMLIIVESTLTGTDDPLVSYDANISLCPQLSSLFCITNVCTYDNKMPSACLLTAFAIIQAELPCDNIVGIYHQTFVQYSKEGATCYHASSHSHLPWSLTSYFFCWGRLLADWLSSLS